MKSARDSDSEIDGGQFAMRRELDADATMAGEESRDSAAQKSRPWHSLSSWCKAKVNYIANSLLAALVLFALVVLDFEEHLSEYKWYSKLWPGALGVNIKAEFYDVSVGQVLPLTDESVLSAGDSFRLRLQAEGDGYLYVYHYDSAGQLTVLFPMSLQGSGVADHKNPVSKGKEITLPPNNSAYLLNDNAGAERIVVINTRKPRRELEDFNQYFGMEGSSVSQNGARLMGTQKQIAEFTDKFLSLRDGLADACPDCVKHIVFEHQ